MASSPQVETVGSGVGKAQVAGSVLLVVLSIAGFYWLTPYGGWAQWGALLVGLVLAAVVFIFSDPGRVFRGYLKDSSNELKKVVWPSRKEAVQMTGYVFAFAVIMSLFLWLADSLVGWVIYDLLLGWRS
ncbi:preprotein translocase subunit SecE [Lampropedia hyalina DSM 16112]|jgi:preprotein translocase subunit SecE|uniref:Protein translocase subunit SecE n=1 Tax=Lampropedia hyalina DSM 16112 TaxID=1122156 RepID=A0A1M5E793_9BURK|nr:preprotein translocase subunit SecE [Lampropedia hyalina]SHF75060.1 preprotein translocase subunit SecE [Lampropedia hyalina DSM 16112]